jgi:hypothetical protein
MMMKEADSDRIRELCSIIAVEQNHHKLLQFIEELSQLLGARDDQHVQGNQMGG